MPVTGYATLMISPGASEGMVVTASDGTPFLVTGCQLQQLNRGGPPWTADAVPALYINDADNAQSGDPGTSGGAAACLVDGAGEIRVAIQAPA